MKNGRLMRIGLFVGMMVAAIVLYYLLIGRHVAFGDLVAQREHYKALVQERFLFSAAIYFLLYLFVCLLPIPGETGLTLVGGFLFGIIPGTLIILVSATCGAALAFLLSRYAIGGAIKNIYGESVKNLYRAIEQNGYNYLLSIRFLPVVPFFVVNYVAGLTMLPLFTFMWTTAVGILPLILVYIFAGQQLGSIKSVHDVLTWPVLLGLGALAFMALLPVFYRMVQRRR